MTLELQKKVGTQIEFQLLNPSNEQWLNFLTLGGDCNIFHHPTWLELLAQCYGYRPFIIAACDPAGLIQMGLPMMEVNTSLTSRRWISLPFTDHCTPVVRENISLQQVADWLDSLFRQGLQPKIELRTKLSPSSTVMIRSDFVLHTLKLGSDTDFQFSQIHNMHRRNIKRANTKNISIEFGDRRDHLDKYYQLHLCTRQRQGMPVQPKKFFDLLHTLLIERGLGFILLAHCRDQCVAGAVFLHCQQTLTYKYGASNQQGCDLRANNLLMWRAVQWGCENGFAKLDMGRSSISNTGLRTYKSRWGAVEEPLIYSFFCSKSPHLMNGRLTAIQQTVIRNSPSWVCRIAGELLYRHVA